MATIRKRNGKFEAQIRRRGHRAISKTFIRRSDAKAWAKRTEADIERGLFVQSQPSPKLRDLLERYNRDYVPLLRGVQQVGQKCRFLAKELGHHKVSDITSSVLSTYRDKRLQQVGPQTVVHELSLIKRVLRISAAEWAVQLPNGVPDVIMPKLPRGRNRRLKSSEESALFKTLTRYPLMLNIVRFALETAMRRGEIAAMQWEHINFQQRLLKIPETKTGVPRIIPLSSRAVNLLHNIPRRVDCKLWGMTASSISHRFLWACRELVLRISGFMIFDMKPHLDYSSEV